MRIIKSIEEVFPKKKVVIVGDLIADQFLYGTIDRVSREAPVFILRHEKTTTLAGGAGNAAVNVASLGGKSFLVGLVGNDQNGAKLLDCLKNSQVDCSGVVISSDYETITKVRVLASRHHATRQQVIRIDYESQKRPSREIERKIAQNFLQVAKDSDAIVISDYNYGVVSADLAKVIKDFAASNKIPLLVDSRYRLREFAGMTSATPNQEEVEELVGKKLSDEQDLITHCKQLHRELNCQALLVTLGSKGMILFEENKKELWLDAVGSKEPVDVTGAGDTVIATYSLALASGLSFAEAAMIANHAGGIVVMKKGTASVTSDELIESWTKEEKFRHAI